MRRTQLLTRICASLLFTAVICFLWPFVKSAIGGHEVTGSNDGSFGEALSNSVVFASVSSILIVLVSLFMAIALEKIGLRGNWSNLSTWLLLPALLGNVSTAFIWKLLLYNNNYFFADSWHNFLALLLMQGWQYGPFFIYLFWLQLKDIPQARLAYTRMARMTWQEQVRDIFLPRLQNLVVLLLMLQFIFSFYEDAKIEFIFKASRGTHAEMLTQWFSRTYQSNALVNMNFAFRQIGSWGLEAMAALILAMSLVRIFIHGGLRAVMRSRRAPIFLPSAAPAGGISKGLLLLVLTLIGLPLIYVIVAFYHLTPHSLAELAWTVIYTLTAAVLATGLAVLFSILLRMGWRRWLEKLNKRAMPFIFAIFLISLVPPVALLASGYQWMGWIGYGSPAWLRVVWLLGQVIIAFPLLAGFTIFTYFEVSNKDMAYLQIHRGTWGGVVRTIFVSPYRGHYVFTFLVAFALIWNEPIINSILSDQIPSFVSQIELVITGRLVDYAKGIEFLMVSLVLSATAITVWNILTQKRTT